MSLHQFFLTNQVLSQETDAVFELQLDVADLKHAQVLRLACGEHIAVIDASLDYFECEVKDISRDTCWVSIAQHKAYEPPAFELTLVQGLAKADKMETIIRHATEVGVSCFLPVVFSRSVVKLDPKKALAKTERWQSIAKSAAQQSGQVKLPKVSSPITVDELLSFSGDYDVLVVFWEEAPLNTTLVGVGDEVRKRLSSAKAPDSSLMKSSDCMPLNNAPLRIALVVGPEGGLTSSEVQKLRASNPSSFTVSLGTSILRTETAGIVAPALVNYELSRKEVQEAQGESA